MKFRLNIRQGFSVVFLSEGLVNRAYFFVIVPFLTSLLALLAQMGGSGALVVAAILALVILNILYQLYLWQVSFFYSQQISEGDWSPYLLTLSELTTDLEVKLKLFLIRLFWNTPLVALLVGTLFWTVFSANDNSLQFANAESFVEVFSGLPWSLLAVIFVAGQILIENALVNISSFIYSETGSLKQSLQVFRVIRLLRKQIVNYVIVAGLSVVPQIASVLLILPLALILTVPLLGGLILGFLTGLAAIFSTLFIPNLQGQIWRELKRHD